MSQIGVSNPPQSVPTGMAACEGRKAILYAIDFSKGLNYQVDLTILFNQGTIKSVQSIYVDNLDNATEKTFIFSASNQRVTIPAGQQGYIPILQPEPPQFTVSSTSADKLNIQVLNFFMPPHLWGNLFGGTVTVTDPILDATVVNNRVQTTELPGAAVLTNRSGTITAGGAGQSLMAANAARTYWDLQNPTSATEILQFSPYSDVGPWYDLQIGGFVSSGAAPINKSQIWVIAATTTHAFTSSEGQ